MLQYDKQGRGLDIPKQYSSIKEGENLAMVPSSSLAIEFGLPSKEAINVRYWNSLPSQIRLLPKSYTPLLYTSCLKLIFFTVDGLEAPLSSFLEGALYKFSK